MLVIQVSIMQSINLGDRLRLANWTRNVFICQVDTVKISPLYLLYDRMWCRHYSICFTFVMHTVFIWKQYVAYKLLYRCHRVRHLSGVSKCFRTAAALKFFPPNLLAVHIRVSVSHWDKEKHGVILPPSKLQCSWCTCLVSLADCMFVMFAASRSSLDDVISPVTALHVAINFPGQVNAKVGVICETLLWVVSSAPCTW